MAADEAKDVVGVEEANDALAFVDEGDFFVGVFEEYFSYLSIGFVVAEVGDGFEVFFDFVAAVSEGEGVGGKFADEEAFGI